MNRTYAYLYMMLLVFGLVFYSCDMDIFKVPQGSASVKVNGNSFSYDELEFTHNLSVGYELSYRSGNLNELIIYVHEDPMIGAYSLDSANIPGAYMSTGFKVFPEPKGTLRIDSFSEDPFYIEGRFDFLAISFLLTDTMHVEEGFFVAYQ